MDRISTEISITKPTEVVPGVEKPSLILAQMVAASILQYPECVSYEDDPVDWEKEKNSPRYMVSHYYICKWSHPVNGMNVHFKARRDGYESYIGFVLSFTKQKCRTIKQSSTGLILRKQSVR